MLRTSQIITFSNGHITDIKVLLSPPLSLWGPCPPATSLSAVARWRQIYSMFRCLGRLRVREVKRWPEPNSLCQVSDEFARVYVCVCVFEF